MRSACPARWRRMRCCGDAALRAGFASALPVRPAPLWPMPGWKPEAPRSSVEQRPARSPRSRRSAERPGEAPRPVAPMSGIAGLLRFDGQPVARRDLERMANALKIHGPDRSDVIVTGSVGLVHVLMRMTPEDQFDRQP